MADFSYHFWKKSPFLKILLGMITGILLQWHFQFNPSAWWIILVISLSAFILYFFIPFFNRYQYNIVSGILATLLFISFGALLAWNKDIRNTTKWIGHYYQETNSVIAKLDEPLSEKTKSYKANATVLYVIQGEKPIPVDGKIIVYFRKDQTEENKLNAAPQPGYGSIMVFKKQLQEIKNSGNPGGFDYKRYCLFQGITYQVFLKPTEFELISEKNENWFNKFIFTTREKVLDILRTNIKSEKELGLAEALLIGYKDDLEQSLVQSYTNTGVVHIIAISGLHLGLIYWLLSLVLKPLKKTKIKWLRPVLIISGLWLFSLMAGAQPSILRSALMFTCIVLGDVLGKKGSIFNTLAISAFILLCINPYWLWDVGFQLSYSAVLSIIIFLQPVYNWFYIKNKLLDLLWKMNAVTIAAQVLTLPISIYHFHQFPNYFLLTNFLAVPLSSLILLGEILLCAIAWLPALALLVGKLIYWLIWLMNTWIEKIESLRFSLWDSLQINILQIVVLIFFVSGIAYWLLEKAKTGLMVGLISLLCFIALRSYSFITTEIQKKIIVYNVPQRRAVDFINRRNYFFVGDSDLLADDFARNFHLKPSRIFYRITPKDSIDNFRQDGNYIQFNHKKILLIDSTIRFLPTENKPEIDLLVISKNPKLYITKLAASLNIKQIVFDGSVPPWKTTYWKKDCDSLHIPYYDVTTKGAFVMNWR